MTVEQLNDPQRRAVTLTEGHALVLAGAGSGKTKVLTTRIAWLIQNRLASPLSILAVTFTNKASKEMQSRVGAMLPIDTRGMWIGTFHGLCHRMLRAHSRDAGLPQTFQILDTTDQLALIKRLLKANGIDEDKYPARDAQRFINRCKEEGLRAPAVQVDDPFSRRMRDIYELYEAQCQREGVVDFPELLLRALELLQNHEPVRTHYQQRFRHILVDEFQDTNPLQYAWLQLLAGDGTCLFAVGDDDQSIYAFRGANVGNMADFERDYARGNVIRLEQNYRSHGHILDAANALIANNTGRLGKTLWTDAGQGELVRLCEQPSDHAEAQWVLDEIRALHDDGLSRQDMAILYRSNAQSRVLEHALFSAGVPYRVYGGLRFFERQEIKHALAYLRLVSRIDEDSAFLRVVNFPARGIGARSIETLTDQANAYQTSLAQAVARVSGKAGSSLAQFVSMIQTLRDQVLTLSLSEAVEQVIDTSGLREHYRSQRDGAERLENLDELVNAAKVFELEEDLAGLPCGERRVRAQDELSDPMTGLEAFLSHAALESGDTQAQAGQDAVQLMTIHAAKGLEFDAVFLTGVEDGLFPHENSMYEPGGLEEERRLMYVAMTRAKKRLYVSLSQSRMLHGQTRYCLPSRFIEEIPEDHVKRLSAKPAIDDWIGSAVATRMGGGYRASSPKSAVASGIEVGGQTFRVGQGVRHPRFGEGTILGLSGLGLDAQAQIHFLDVGTKTLALGVAKLEIIAR
ncbi:UvrD-helicase domain-containing protein [Orrella daihaiensis]|uniref:DNA 3'-5' helicase n=1 Tax=Orrella daihaiensis TaxID=2782176 RepID=A0ABY4AG37_9BURK|nr:UvrD-helicase domain-containing protein [Orrella daihaiensis]UOD49262.1 UvrD-helicase domain-containing protein [Orrella daihaiensis]